MSTLLHVYLARNNIQAGPYTLEQFNHMIANNQIEASDLMWHFGMDNWCTVGEQTIGQTPYAPNITVPSEPQPTSSTTVLTAQTTSSDIPIDRRKNTVHMVISNLSVRAKAKAIDLLLLIAPFVSIKMFSVPQAQWDKYIAVSQQPLDISVIQSAALEMAQAIPMWAEVTSNIYAVVILAVQAYLINKYGQSIGKRLTKIRIIDLRSGKKAMFVQGFLVRSFLFLTLGRFIPILWLVDISYLVMGDRRTMHDRLAKTIVVNAEDHQL